MPPLIFRLVALLLETKSSFPSCCSCLFVIPEPTNSLRPDPASCVGQLSRLTLIAMTPELDNVTLSDSSIHPYHRSNSTSRVSQMEVPISEVALPLEYEVWYTVTGNITPASSYTAARNIAAVVHQDSC